MSFFKKILQEKNQKPQSSSATILNPNQFNNINVFRQNRNSFAYNVFLTNYEFYDINSKKSSKKRLIPVSNEIFKELIYNKSRVKNHSVINIKSLLIKEETIRFENFNGKVKIWLIFNPASQILDYIIQIEPQEVFQNSRNQNLKKLINKILGEIHCSIIFNTLKKFDINVDEKKFGSCKNFRWSFHVQNIPIKQKQLNMNRPPPPGWMNDE
jgi:hypothetical protein